MRIALAGMALEANSFASTQATLAIWQARGILDGERIRDEHATAATIIAGYLAAESEASDVELVPLVSARLLATGVATADAFEHIAGRIVAAVREGGPWDGVLLAQHGAMIADGQLDADGELVRRVRAVVGPDVPIGVTLDLHANVSERLVAEVDVLTVYQTNPHIDAAEQGLACARLLIRTIRGEVRPALALARVPIAIDILRQGTDDEPMRGLLARAGEVAGWEDVLSVSLVEGFPWGDTPQMGASVVAIADGRPDVAARAAESLAADLWSARAELIGDAPGAEDALRLALAEPTGPVVVLDVGDNVGGGSAGDSTHLLHAARAVGATGVAIALSDPRAVELCAAAGVGARVELTVGGRTDDMHGVPFPVRGTVIALHDGRFEDPTPTHGGIRFYDVGATAGLRTDDGLLLAIHSRPSGAFSREQFRIAGIHPESARILIAKGVHSPRAAFEPIATRLIQSSTLGATSNDLASFPYRHRPRPMYPFEPGARVGRAFIPPRSAGWSAGP